MFPPSLQWVPWPPLAGPCGSPPSQVLWGRTTAPPSVHGHLWFPLVAGTSSEEMGSSLGFLENPFGSMPRARDSGGPVRPHPTGRPGTAFRSHNSVGVRHGFDFGAESSRPASLLCTLRTHRSPGEWQHVLPACWLALAGRDSHPLDSTKRFHWLISAPPLPSFSQRDMRVNSKCAHQCAHHSRPRPWVERAPGSPTVGTGV
jgi:hypothetical protein